MNVLRAVLSTDRVVRPRPDNPPRHHKPQALENRRQIPLSLTFAEPGSALRHGGTAA